MKLDLTIGWTRSEIATDENGRERLIYSSFDGYRPGASQHTETITLDLPEGEDLRDALSKPERFVYKLADAAFMATNHPDPEGLTGLASLIYQGIRASGYRGHGAHYSLSVGDTVTIGEVRLACAPFGWDRVAYLEVGS